MHVDEQKYSEKTKQICKNFRILSKITSTTTEYCNIIFMIFQIICYIILRRYLKNNLFYFYRECKTFLLVLFAANIAYYFCTTIKLLLLNFFKISPISMELNQGKSEYKDYERMLYSIISILQWSCLILYCYFNSKNIHFKLYVYVFMQGHIISDRFENISLFITRS